MVLILGLVSLQAQPILGARNTSLGSGGTAYISDVEATFWNPANLAITDQSGRWHLQVGSIGILYEPVLSSGAAGRQFFNFTDSYFPPNPNTTGITSEQRQTILDQNYAGKDLLSQHQSRADILLGGAVWQGKDKAFSIAARARYGSRIEVGRGWYDQNFTTLENSSVRNFQLTQQRNHLYEFSVGYAQSFTFVNGWFSGVNELYIGISPKLVLAGPSLNFSYDAKYFKSGDNQNTLLTDQFTYSSTGKYSRSVDDYRSNPNARQAIQNNYDRNYSIDNTGYGMGVDFGLTYLIPLGKKLPSVGEDDGVINRSIRVSFSINDIGFVRYTDDPMQISTPRDSLIVTKQQSAARSMFIGADGQYINYFDSANKLPNPLLAAQKNNLDNYTALLPSSINTGILLELKRIKLMGDLTLGLRNTAFTSTKLALHLGLEARPHPNVPIRTGARLAAGIPTHLSMGTGIETQHWDFNVGAQILFRSKTFTTDFGGGAFAGIELHL
ncbi:hypothetical protein LX73_0349 [Fodinibius salinus]|uniref:DUF5723 domain-containing protein n=1 Tax=Fodinibius salinus TaxID=860790 RepID=A0A5D3YM91_9BACT|nr:DUF5723 family protein [Fodinibius salinus]TYP95054.1 hypothetical protein LX73_0349 [Fodinibius salinus]